MKLKLLFLLLFICLSIVTTHAQSFECRVENETFSPSDTSYYFDVKLYAKAPTTTWEYATGTYYINMNSAFRNAGTIIASIVASTSELNAFQAPTSVSYNATNNYITIAAKTPPGAGAGTIITQAGLRLIRMRLKNTLAFSTTTAPNLAFRWASPNTGISSYVGGINTVIANNTLTAGQALQGARLASGLLGQRQQMPQMQQPQLQMPQVRPAGAVDYTGLLNLLSPRTARRNPNSLLG
jgi:hypothetical protein